ncbi:MAG: hypothetical protein AAFQ82_28230, partial [Myxococcota bacterium]
RHIQHSFISFSPRNPRVPELLRDYFSSTPPPHAPSSKPSVQGDSFVLEIKEELEAMGATCHVSHPLAGMRVDLVAVKEKRVVGFDLVGFPGPFEERFSLERFRIFYRAGLPIIPIAYSSWCVAPEQVRALLKESLGLEQPGAKAETE